MAIQINKDITVLGSIDVSTLYTRLRCNLHFSGNLVKIYTASYPDRISYESNNQNNCVDVPGLPGFISMDYNREIDGLDILGLAHTKLVNYLTSDKKEWLPLTDTSTGVPILDPSTGEPQLYEETIAGKFCEVGEISIVDVSI